MSFASWHYLFFLVAVVAVYWQLPLRGRWALLWVTSTIFYAAWDPRFVALLLASTVVDYTCGRGIAGEPRRGIQVVVVACLPLLWCGFLEALSSAGWGWLWGQIPPLNSMAWMAAGIFAVIYPLAHAALVSGIKASRNASLAFVWLSVITNLGVLACFKYFDFFRENLVRCAKLLGIELGWGTVEILLPIAISFYTFQSISYAVDIYQGRAQPSRSFLQFAAYLAFFPQLAAGPIERARKFLPQFDVLRSWDPVFLREGLRLLLVGMFKKVFVADNCAPIVRYVFDSGGSLNGYWALLGVVAFAFQIYGDFSGYTDMARGSARLLGFELSTNFRFPYLSKTPSEFWQRWHITLSTWFRDYVYIPLGGNRCGPWRTALNLSIAMVLAGLWHGASWSFVLWGAYHALLLILYRTIPWLARVETARLGGVETWIYRGLFFGLTLVGWALFRSVDMGQFVRWMGALGRWGWVEMAGYAGTVCWVLLHVGPLILWQWACWEEEDEVRVDQWPWAVRGVVYLVAFLAIVTSSASDQEFIYFQF